MCIFPANVKDWAELTAYVVGILAVLFSVCQYFRNSKQERMRWLFELYQRFYADPELRKMRVRIDWGKTDFALNEVEQNAELQGELDDYLNFFEFLAYLKERKVLEDDEIRTMFDYALKKIAEDNGVRQYIGRPDYGYEKLPGLLKELGYAK